MAGGRHRRHSTPCLLHASRSGTIISHPITFSSPKTLILRHLVRFHISIFAGRQQSQRRPQILGPDAVGAQNLSAFASQILRSL